MKRAGIVVDDWKYEIFKDHLTKNGFSFETGPGVTDDTIILYLDVKDEDVQKSSCGCKCSG